MNDRELLELAAKAAGFSVDRFSKSDNYIYTNSLGKWWSPLHDDGDALRLAVKLEIGILQCTEGVDVVLPGGMRIEGWGCGREDATRRAITRAAAEIGRNKQ